MPKTTNKNETNINKETENKKSTPSANDKKIESLEAMVAQLTQQLLDLQRTPTSNVMNMSVDTDINPNKKTRITSLTYGYFSLHAPNRGFLKFPNYGSYHTVSYAQLVDYVNACRTAAENGNFYIHNQDMVEDLGLTEAYDNILNDKIIDKVLYSDELEIGDILSNTTASQKQNICALVCNKVYNKEMTDMTRIDDISKALGVDILKKVAEMKETNEFLSKE